MIFVTIIIQIMEHLSARKPSRGKSSAYASMIKELLQEIQKLTTQNEQLKKDLALKQLSGQEELAKMNTILKDKDDIEMNFKNMQQQIAKEKIMIAVQMANKESQINRLRQENIAHADQIANLKRQKGIQKDNYRDETTNLKKQIAISRLKLQQSEEQKQDMSKQMEEKDKLHRIEVEELRKINSIIKKNFKIMEEDYDQLLKLNEDQPNISLRLHKQHSKPRKSSIALKKSKPIFNSNPQMEQELWMIKQQVSQQMARISNSRQQAVKGRVDHTLATIQSILSELSQRLDTSEEES